MLSYERVPRYGKAVAVSALRYVEIALCGNRILNVPCCRRAVKISDPCYMETEF